MLLLLKNVNLTKKPTIAMINVNELIKQQTITNHRKKLRVTLNCY